MSDKRDILCHFLATLAYRTQKALQNAPDHFGSFRAGSDVRTPQELLHHMSSLINHTLDALRDMPTNSLERSPDFQGEVDRFHALLEQLSAALGSASLQEAKLAERLLQGPFTDAMTHAGQLALLRRLAGAPVPAEDFSRAAIDPKNLSVNQPLSQS